MTLVAKLNVPTPKAARYIDALCAELEKLEFEAVRDGSGARVTLPRALGNARIDGDGSALRVRAEAENERGISVLKFIIGMRIEQVAADEKPDLVWTGYGADFDVLPGFREVTVVRVTNVTPHMRRVTFTGENMEVPREAVVSFFSHCFLIPPRPNDFQAKEQSLRLNSTLT